MKVLLTGRPGCGKTTLVERVVDAMGGEARLSGFVTREVRTGAGRAGFDILTLDGRRGVLARKGSGPGPRVGSYRVDVASLESLAVPTMDDPSAEAFVVDEIGLMELRSRRFEEAVLRLMDDPRPTLATIRLKPHPFCDALKARPGVEVLTVTEDDRDPLVSELASRLLQVLGRS